MNLSRSRSFSSRLEPLFFVRLAGRGDERLQIGAVSHIFLRVDQFERLIDVAKEPAVVEVPVTIAEMSLEEGSVVALLEVVEPAGSAVDRDNSVTNT